MDDLISLSETMTQASTLLADGVPGEESRPNSFLQVIPLGYAGSGKSSVLNTLIGHPVLPTAEGSRSRHPLVIDIERRTEVGAGVRGKIGANSNLQSSADIRKAVLTDMTRPATASSKSQDSRLLVVQSSSAPPLRLVDLPGIEARPSESDDAIFDHGGGNTILLVILPANKAKEAGSLRSLKMVQNMDREGSRSVGVITMLDMVKEDKQAVAAVVEILSGKGPSVTQDYPWVAVVGQPRNEKTAGDSLEEAWKAEAAVLGNILRSSGSKGLEPKLGREGLVRTLARQVRKRMKERIPRIMNGLEARSQEVDDELLKLGDTVLATEDGSRAVALELCRGFDDKFIESIEGGEGGGAKMVEKFVGALPGRFRKLPLDRLFSMENVKKVTTEADGYQPYLTSPEKGLRLLIKRCLDLAKEPGLQCVDEVHKILNEVVTMSSNTAPSLARFGPLKREIIALASNALEEYRAEARLMVSSLVDMERVFIPPGHFIDAAARRFEKVRREEELIRKRDTERSKRLQSDASSDEPKQPGRLSQAMSSLRGKSSAPPAPAAAPTPQPAAPPGPQQELAGYLWKVSSKNGWSKRWFALSDKTARLYYVKKPEEKTPRGVIPLEDCIIEDVVLQEEVPSIPGDPLRGSATQSLVFKINNKVPYKTVVKVHHSLILRAENAAEKQLWVARMRALTKSDNREAAVKEEEQPPPPAEPESAQAEDSSAPPPPPPRPDGDKPLKRAPTDPEEELKYMALEVREYVEAVLGHLSANIPKAIVLTQVEKVKDSMLTKLYTSISKLPNERISQLLFEDPDSKGKREKAQKQQAALSKLKRMLSLHEAKASAEDANSAPPPKENPVTEEWRLAFQQSGNNSSSDIPEEVPVPTSRSSSRKSDRQNPDSNGVEKRGQDRPSKSPSRRDPRDPPAPPSGGGSQVISATRQAPPPPEPAPAPTPQPGPPMSASRRPTRLPPPPPQGGGGGGFLKF